MTLIEANLWRYNRTNKEIVEKKKALVKVEKIFFFEFFEKNFLL